jgi:Uma2 family endonuclease
MSLLHPSRTNEALAEEELVFTREDLAELPESFPRCVIRDGKIARADGLPLEWEQYELLEEDFPAVLTETGELQMAPPPTDIHEKGNGRIYTLLGHYLRCHPGGEVLMNRALRIVGYQPAVPDLVFFRHPNPESEGKSYTDQIPDLTVEILSPSNKGKEWEDKLALYRDRCPEVWLFQLDGSAEIWGANGLKINVVQPGDLFSSPLFPGLAIDPAWIRDYPDEMELVRRFTPKIRVLSDPDDPELTRKAQQLAVRIAQHFERSGRQG